jgi:hypothetical protein
MMGEQSITDVENESIVRKVNELICCLDKIPMDLKYRIIEEFYFCFYRKDGKKLYD